MFNHKVIHSFLSVLNDLQEDEDIAKELTIFSKMIFKYNNAHKHQKYFRVTRKIDNNMRKFAGLKLVNVIKHDLDLMR